MRLPTWTHFPHPSNGVEIPAPLACSQLQPLVIAGFDPGAIPRSQRVRKMGLDSAPFTNPDVTSAWRNLFTSCLATLESCGAMTARSA